MTHAHKTNDQNFGLATAARSGGNIQPPRQIHGKNQKAAGGQRNPTPHIQASPTQYANAALLTNIISPVWMGHVNSQLIHVRFYASARRLCRYYGLTPLKPSRAPFPAGLIADYEILKRRLQASGRPLGLFVADQQANMGCVGTYTKAVFDPVYLQMAVFGGMVTADNADPAIPMIAKTFNYLLDVVGLNSLYGNVTVSNLYNDIWQCAGDMDGYDEEEEEGKGRGATIYEEMEEDQVLAAEAIDCLLNHRDLSQWGQAMTDYAANTPAQQKLKAACNTLYRIYQQFPIQTMEDHIFPDLTEKDDETITVDEFLGFQLGNGPTLTDEFETWAKNSEWEEPRHFVPIGYRLFGPHRKAVVVSCQFQEKIYSACSALYKALQKPN